MTRRRDHFDRLLLAALWLGVGGCVSDVGKPTDMEVQQMSAWAEVVTPKDREEVTRQANMHTDWMERRKVQWITGEYKRRYMKLKGKPATTTTSPASSQPGLDGF